MTRMGWDCYSDAEGHGEAMAAARGGAASLSAGSVYLSFGMAGVLGRHRDALAIKAVDGVVNLNVNTSNYLPEIDSKIGVSWPEIVNGQHDETLQAWADAITAFGSKRLVFTVGGHEPNIDNPYQPKHPDSEIWQFPALAEKVHTFFRAAGVQNRIAVIPTVSVFNGYKRRPPLWDVIAPDPAHYDLIGADHYTHEWNWQTPAEKGEPFVATAEALGKRLVVGEIGNDHADVRRVQWYREAAAFYDTARALFVNWNMKTDERGDYGLEPGTPEWSALLEATRSWT